MRLIPTEVIEKIQRSCPGVDLLFDSEREVHVIVQRLRAPVPVDERLRNVVPEARNGANAIPYEFIGYCHITYQDGSVIPFIPDMSNADNIIRAIKTCTIRMDDDTGWREFEDANKAAEEKNDRDWKQFLIDSAKEMHRFDSTRGAGRRHSTAGVQMTRNIRG